MFYKSFLWTGGHASPSPPRQTRLSLLSEKAFESVSRLTRPANIYFQMKETSDGTSNVPATFNRGVSTINNKYYVYILFNLQDKGLYIGFTTNLKERLTQHAKGEVPSTKLRIPFKLIHYEYFINKKDAKAREEFIKSGFGRKQLKQFLKTTLEEHSK